MGALKNLFFLLSDEQIEWLKFLQQDYQGYDPLMMTEYLSENREIQESIERILHLLQEQKRQPELTVKEIQEIIETAFQRQEKRMLAQIQTIVEQQKKTPQTDMELERKIKEIYEYVKTQKTPQQPVIPPEVTARISELENQVKGYQRYYEEFHKQSFLLQQANQRALALEQELSSVRAELERIKLERFKEKEIASKEQKEESKKARKKNIFSITKNTEQYFICPETFNDFIEKVKNTRKLEQFFEEVPEENSYQKYFRRYQENLQRMIKKLEDEAEIEDKMNDLVKVIQNNLLKKLMVAIYRGMKIGEATLEYRLLEVLNWYLEEIGMYCRESIKVGKILEDKDYEDMELLRDDQTPGKAHGEILEIELYPYYLNYVDEDGEREKVHTEGMMIVAG